MCHVVIYQARLSLTLQKSERGFDRLTIVFGYTMKFANFKIIFTCITLTSHFLYQQTLLHIAAREGQEITVKCLVKKGADINIEDNNGVGV